MLGGEAAVMARVEPVLNAYSTDTMLVGPLGSAMALKICNNLIAWCEIMLGIEAARIAEAASVPLEKLLTAMTRNGVLSPPMKSFIDFRSNPGDRQRRDMMAVQAYIGEKDLTLASELAGEVTAPSPIAAFVRDRVRRSILDICNS